MTDAEALDRIAKLMSGVEWDSELPCEVADVVRQTGREILDLPECDCDEEDDDDDGPVEETPRHPQHRCSKCGLQWFTEGLRPLTGAEDEREGATGRCNYCNGVCALVIWDQ